MYAIGITAFGLRNILDKVFYSLQDTKTPMKNGIITVIINIILNLILIKVLGHTGLKSILAGLVMGVITAITFDKMSNRIGRGIVNQVILLMVSIIVVF